MNTLAKKLLESLGYSNSTQKGVLCWVHKLNDGEVISKIVHSEEGLSASVFKYSILTHSKTVLMSAKWVYKEKSLAIKKEKVIFSGENVSDSMVEADIIRYFKKHALSANTHPHFESFGELKASVDVKEK
jgi:hypothetical protein